MREDEIREQQLFNYLEQQEEICPVCNVSFERGYEEANTIESEGACPDCLFDAMLQTLEPDRCSTGKSLIRKEREIQMAKTKTTEKATPIVKVDYSATPITTVPGPSDADGGFNPSRHNPLKSDDFKSMDIWLEWRAAKAQRTADKLMKEAETFRKYGDPTKRNAAKKLETAKKKFEEMQAKLSEQLGPEAVAELLAAIETA